jgi:alkylated DNA repair dioxygenase AlkB
MDLFNDSSNSNILPYDGEVIYLGKIIPNQQANFYFDSLLNTIEWKNDAVIMFDKHIVTARKIAWYGDKELIYTYSGTTKKALLWTKELLQLKKIVEDRIGQTFNSCLLNLYHNGSEGLGWHSDNERYLGSNPAIASFSFGADRKFSFKHKKTKQTVSIILEHGSLLIMKGETQKNWLHKLPPTTKVSCPRINLTFRSIVSQ